MSEPTVKFGTYTGATGNAVSVSLGFVPDYVKITNMTSLAVYEAYPSRNGFSNGTAIQLGSGVIALGAAGNNHFGDTNPGSYIMAMGGPNDLSTSTKTKGFYVGVKLRTNTSKYIYVAMRSGAGEQGGIS